MKATWLRLAILSCFLVLAQHATLAQRTTATIYGAVADPANASVPGAKVTITNEQTGAQASALADEHGEFTLTFLAVGLYRVEVEAPGFKAFVQSGLALAAGQQIRYPVMLQVGAPTDKITVTAEAPVVQSASPGLADAISRVQLSTLPHANRDFTQLLALENGYRPAKDSLIQFNGLAAGGLTITVDGVDGSGSAEVSSPAMFQNFNPIKVLSEEAVQEVAVSKGVMSAEYAHTYSGNINVITKGGSNQFHGSLFESDQNNVFNAKAVQQKPGDLKPPVHINQFGGSLGGPIKKDKLFFFFAYEGYRQVATSLSTGQVPTAEYRAQLLAAIPSSKTILDLYPLPTSPLPNNTTVGLFTGLASTSSVDNNIVARGDYLLSSTNRLTLRYNHLKPNQLNPRFPPSFRRNYFGTNESGAASFIHAAPSWTAETRFGFNYLDVQRVETLWTNGKIPAIQLNNVVNVQGEGFFKHGHSYTMEEVVAKTRGRHSFKMGALYGAHTPGNFDEQVPGFTYSNAADLLANKPSAVQVTFPVPDYHAREWEMGFFVQDDFRIRSNFMLNLGFRYEYFSVFKEQNGLLYNPDGPYAAVQRPISFRPADSEYRSDKAGSEPRVGLVWNPDRTNKTVIRSGIGLFKAQPLLNNMNSVYANPNIPSRFNLAQSDITSLGITYPMTNEQFLTLFNSRSVPAGYAVFDPNYRNPYSVQWTLDVQRQLTSSLVFQTAYVGNKGLKIVANHNINLPDRVTGLRPFPNALQSGWNNNSDFSYYHAWENSIRKRFSHNLNFNLHYTFGRAMAINEGDFYSGSNARVQDETNWRANKGPASFDIAHRVVGDWTYELPIAQWTGAHGFLKRVAEGWQFSGTMYAQSGDRLDITEKSNYDSSRPDYVGGDIYSTTGDRLQWFNTAAFAQVPIIKASGVTARPGNVGKYIAKGPGSWGTNFGIGKSISIVERVRLQIRADAFNAFNHVNLGNPVTEITSATFGRILSFSAGRTMMLNAKLTF